DRLEERESVARHASRPARGHPRRGRQDEDRAPLHRAWRTGSADHRHDAPLGRRKKIGLEIGLDQRVPLVHADPDRVLEVLINMVDNAIKFTPAEGSVMVQASMVDADPSHVYISVSDTGRGISPEAKALIFERLYQDPDSIDNNR